MKNEERKVVEYGTKKSGKYYFSASSDRYSLFFFRATLDPFSRFIPHLSP